MIERNRSEGWKHAKISGHVNERLIETLLNSGDVRTLLPSMAKEEIKEINIGGLKELGIDGILGRKTKSKADLKIVWRNGSQSNFSIKKSLGGQVFLIKTTSFIKGFEGQYKKAIPKNVKNALLLFFGEGNEALQILKELPIEDKDIRKYEFRKKRLTWTSLQKCYPNDAVALIQWIKDNIEEIADFCFSRGLAENQQDWAHYVWYKNIVDDSDLDFCVSINELKKACLKSIQHVKQGERGGGTTIQLPFGFVQWHQGQMQFHHKLVAIKNLPGINRK